MNQSIVIKGRILIVGTEETLLHPAIDLLREQGHECNLVPDLDSAKLLVSDGYDLLITDTAQLRSQKRTDITDLLGLADNPCEPSYLPVNTFIKHTIDNLKGSLSDLRWLADTLSEENTKRSVCHLLDCPRLDRLTDAIIETVDVLEKTKGTRRPAQEAGANRERRSGRQTRRKLKRHAELDCCFGT